MVVAIAAGTRFRAYASWNVEAAQPAIGGRAASLDPAKLFEARRCFFNARYESAAALTLEMGRSHPQDLEALELRTSALLFQLKDQLEGATDKDKAFKQCVPCVDWMAAFLRDTARGQVLARDRLRSTPGEEHALFFLGKLDLNYVWLQLGPLGRKTGWDEYWEARRSLDALLKRNPAHLRGRVARAWIDYIVDTRMPRGTRWVLGGGNRKRALLTMQEAASADADFFVHAEAAFALWDLHVRERNLPAAIEVARGLARDFPDNPELSKFLEAHDSYSQRLDQIAISSQLSALSCRIR